ncbi:MAG: energy transducer TonB [Crocinitomicaceae bacterium]|nr:energy transducer TonB [Crocinitomicaceae bacterium]
MSILKGLLPVFILFLFVSCEHDEKKSSPKKILAKAVIQQTPKVHKSPKTEKQTRRIIPEKIPMVFIDPHPPGPEPDPLPYDPGEPPVVYPTGDPVVIKADTIYDFPPYMPEFPGGQQALIDYLQKNLVYPEDAKEQGIEGKVYVSFVVFEDGSIQQVTILRGIKGNNSCEKEVLRLIKRMPNWIPGKDNVGNELKARVKIPVVFNLD